MALSFPSFHSWLCKSSTPSPNPNSSSNAFSNANPNPGFPVSSGDAFVVPDVDAFQLNRSSKDKNSCPQKICESTRRKAGKGRKSRQKQSLDLDFDVVIVQPNYFSGSESEGSDWSVGWFEPHAPEFCSDGEPENSFAVLVPCYGSPSADSFGTRSSNSNWAYTSNSQPWAEILTNAAKDSHTETNFYLQQWVSSLKT